MLYLSVLISVFLLQILITRLSTDEFAVAHFFSSFVIIYQHFKREKKGQFNGEEKSREENHFIEEIKRK